MRPLRDGTPASRIFWPAVARGADPQERRLRADGDSRPLVVLDPRGAAGIEELDAAVRAAASLAHALARAGGCGVLLPGDRRATELDRHARGLADRATRAWRWSGPTAGPSLVSVAQRRGPVIFVSARMRLRAAAGARRRPRRDARARRARRSLDGRAAAFAVAGCHGYVLGGRRADVARRRRREHGGRARMSARGVHDARRSRRARRTCARRWHADARAAGAPLAPRDVRRLRRPRAWRRSSRWRRSARTRWMQMVRPAASGAMALVLLAALAAGPALIAVAGAAPARARAGSRGRARRRRAARRRARRRGRAAATCSARARGTTSRPASARASSAVPNVRVPYRGADEWTRIVIVLGGVGARRRSRCCWRSRRAATSGSASRRPPRSRWRRCTSCPSMQREGDHPYLGGAVVRAAAGAVSVARARRPALGAVGRRRRRGGGARRARRSRRRSTRRAPLVDYEQLAQSLSAAPSTRYDWNHGYGPLDWPRDGERRAARQGARPRLLEGRQPDAFDGTRWMQAQRAGARRARTAGSTRPTPTGCRRSASRSARCARRSSSPPARRSRSATRRATRGADRLRRVHDEERPLRRGDAYRAVVYTPRPSGASCARPPRLPGAAGQRADARSCCPAGPAAAAADARRAASRRRCGARAPTTRRPCAAIEASPYARAYELAQRLRARAATP